MVADASGIVAIPQEVAETLLQRLDAHRDAAARYLDAVQRGNFSNAWVDTLLREQDCPFDPPGDAAGDGRPFPSVSSIRRSTKAGGGKSSILPFGQRT